MPLIIYVYAESWDITRLPLCQTGDYSMRGGQGNIHRVCGLRMFIDPAGKYSGWKDP